MVAHRAGIPVDVSEGRAVRWLHRGITWVTAGAALVVVLVLVNIVLVEMNRSLQQDIQSRQQFIQQSISLEALNREIITAIANLSVKHKDDALKTVLTQHGITFQAAPPSTGTPSSASGSAATRPGS